MSAFFIEPLQSHHDRKNFDCGEKSLNDYLQRYARQNAENGSSRTYVAVRPDENQICGYFTLSAGTVAVTDFPEEIRRGWPRLVPSVHLGRIAVDTRFQRQRLGNSLMVAVFETATEASDLIGIAVVELWAINDTVRAFYERFEFAPLLDDPLHLYVPISTIRNLS